MCVWSFFDCNFPPNFSIQIIGLNKKKKKHRCVHSTNIKIEIENCQADHVTCKFANIFLFAQFYFIIIFHYALVYLMAVSEQRRTKKKNWKRHNLIETYQRWRPPGNLYLCWIVLLNISFFLLLLLFYVVISYIFAHFF